jgi:hypothetical protein
MEAESSDDREESKAVMSVVPGRHVDISFHSSARLVLQACSCERYWSSVSESSILIRVLAAANGSDSIEGGVVCFPGPYTAAKRLFSRLSLCSALSVSCRRSANSDGNWRRQSRQLVWLEDADIEKDNEATGLVVNMNLERVDYETRKKRNATFMNCCALYKLISIYRFSVVIFCLFL